MRLVRFVLCTLLVLCSTAIARAGDIVIVAQTVQNWQGTVAPLLYVTYDTPFTSSDNVAVLAQPGVYQKVQCSLNTTTHVLTIPQFTIKSTEDGKDDRTSTVSFTFYNPNGSKIGSFGGYTGLRVPATIVASVACSPTGGCATFSDLAIYNAGSPHLPETTYYDARAIDQKLAAITGMVSGIHDPGSNGLLSRTALNAVTPRSIAIGANLTGSNLDGVTGNPTIGLAANVVVGASAPLAINGSGNISIPLATSSVDGYLSATDRALFFGKQAALGFTPEDSANKNATGGYAGLSGGKLALSQGQEVWALADLSDVTAKKGNSTIVQMQTGATATDDCAKFDVNGNLVSAGNPCGSGGGAVSSVFGRTGVVVAASNDYNFNQVAGSVTNAQLAGSIADSKLLTISTAGKVADSALSSNVPLLNVNNAFTGKITITPSSGLGRALDIVQTGSGSGGDTAYNKIAITDTAAVGGAFTEGLRVTHNFGGGATTGGREAIYGEALLNSPSNAGSANRNYVGGVFVGQANSADGGTNLSSGAQGAFFGANPIGVSVNGATNLLEVTAGEADIAMRTGSSAVIKYGWSISQMFDDAVRGASVDAALGISNQAGTAPGWLNGILFTNANGANPLASTANILATSGSATVANGIDISSYTVTGNAWLSTKFRITGAGVPSINNATIDAWDASIHPMYFDRDFTLGGQGGANPSFNLTDNGYFDGSVWRYIESGATNAGATNYFLNQGTHTFRTAVAGTAGNIITWNTALTIDVNGNTTVSGGLFPMAPKITPPSGTGITVNDGGEVRQTTASYTFTFAALAAAQLTADTVVCVLPAKTRLLRITADVTQVFSGGAVSAASIVVGKTTGGAEYLASFDCKSSAITRGLVDADLGTSLVRSAAVQGGDLPSWTTTTNVMMRLTTVTAFTNALNQGSITITLTTERLP